MRLFGIYFIVEIVLLVVAGRLLGIGLTLFILFATAIVGILVIRLAGFSTMLGIRQKIARGETPDGDMMDGMLLGAGGLLLFLPGLLGDVMGLLLVIPSTRTKFVQIAKKVLAKYSMKEGAYHHAHKENQKTSIIEGEWHRKDD